MPCVPNPERPQSRLQNRLQNRTPMSPEDLQRLVSQPMPFGKHKGTLIADLSGNYLGWFAREGFPKGEIGRLLALMYEIDHNDLRALLQPLRRPR